MILTTHHREDSVIWVCWSSKCKKFKRSIRHNTIFLGIKISFKKIVQVMYKWCQKTNLKAIKHEYGIDYKAINSVIAIIRKKITKKISQKIGDNGKNVEIDETCVSKRKFNKGRMVKNMWCVGGISRETKAFFFEVVETRNMANLDKIIEKNVHINTLVMTDEWKGYLNVENLGFFHKKINHSKHFVGPNDTSIHTQNIENL
ncbi:hypothetical protein CDIK_1734 [Cucumispora dikerogammari]|nr:hypothetical protein CDIK_1734 [Cucumispora dikerogammari]